jgi:methylglyoxal reductase
MDTTLPMRVLGRTGMRMPALGIGCWPIGGPDFNLDMPMGWSTADDDESRAGLELAHALGARLFDTADVYGHGHSERLIGELVSTVDRDQLVLTSKVGYFSGTAPHGYQPGHMRHQLEQSLTNLRTNHLDIYFFHHPDFGPDDRWLDDAIAAMRSFRAEGLMRWIGLRGPHRFAPDRRGASPTARRRDKTARFEYLFGRIEPDVLAVRDNLLTPSDRSTSIFEFAERHGCGVLVNKPLGQGLLAQGSYSGTPLAYGDGDHRTRKRWFTPHARAVITDGLNRLRELLGRRDVDLISLALWSCLTRSDSAVVLAGFTRVHQVRTNLACLRNEPTSQEVVTARVVMAEVRQKLDQLGEVFLDERSPETV